MSQSTVTVSKLATTSVTVVWVPATKSIQDSYELRYKGTKQATEWTTAGLVTVPQKDITGLFPGDQYTFEVKTVSNTQTSAARKTTIDLGKYLETSIMSCKLYLIHGESHLQEHIKANNEIS